MRRISMATRDELVRAVSERYGRASREERGRILDEFAAVTGLHRKHAVRLLRGGAPSTLRTVSASASYAFRGSIAHPTQSLCTLRRGRHLPRRNTRYQAGATPYLHRSSTGWTAPASPAAHVTQ